MIAVGGLDPSGGAGIAADLRAIHRAGAWGCPVAASLTVQSTQGLRAVEAVDARLVRRQLEELAADTAIGVVKTGALASADNLRAITRFVSRHELPLVVDPVVHASRGKRLNLLGGRTVQDLGPLIRQATVITPNLAEATLLTGAHIETPEQARDAAIELLELGPRSVLLKGGHGGGERVVDWLATRTSLIKLSRSRVPLAENVHGTGCTLASLLAGRLATLGVERELEDAPLIAAARWATKTLARMLSQATVLGSGQVLGAPRERRR